MKFKYNFFENKLWKIEDDYFYEISEENRYISPNKRYLTELNVDFIISQDHQLNFLIYSRILGFFAARVSYAKKLKNGQTAYYEKKIVSKTSEIIFEFTEANKSE